MHKWFLELTTARRWQGCMHAMIKINGDASWQVKEAKAGSLVINRDRQNITHEEAQDLISTVNRWTDMPPNKKAELRQRVNELLDSEDIPQVDSDIMNWRMPKAFKKIAS